MPAVLLMQAADAGIAAGDRLDVVGGTVVDDEHLDVRVVLGEDALDRLRQEVRLPEAGDDDADQLLGIGLRRRQRDARERQPLHRVEDGLDGDLQRPRGSSDVEPVFEAAVGGVGEVWVALEDVGAGAVDEGAPDDALIADELDRQSRAFLGQHPAAQEEVPRVDFLARRGHAEVAAAQPALARLRLDLDYLQRAISGPRQRGSPRGGCRGRRSPGSGSRSGGIRSAARRGSPPARAARR